MFEGVVANLLNKYLGKYIQNLDSKNLEVGILGGQVELTGLTLRPEALYELDLPIEVKAGYVGKITIEVDWFNVLSKPAIVNIEDVYALAGPVIDRKYDAGRETDMEMAKKKKKLDDLDKTSDQDANVVDENQGWIESLAATIVNNLQVTIQKVHIRYEDNITNPDHPFACGIMLNNLTAETTDANWKSEQVDGDAKSVHKLSKLSGLSVYWNPYLPEQTLVRNKTGTSVWRNLLKNSIDAHRILDEEFDFILKPISANAKVTMNKGSVLSVPRLIFDFFMDDIEVLISRQQFLNMLCLQESFKIMAVNQRYRRYHPGVPFKGHISKWWKYAFTSVVEEKIRPFSWERIKAHRLLYNNYKDAYKRKLKGETSESLIENLKEFRSKLDVSNIIIARGQAKYEFSREEPDKVEKKKEVGWWDWLTGGGDEDEDDIVPKKKEVTTADWILDNLSDEEKEQLFASIGPRGTTSDEDSPEYIAHTGSINLRACSVSLVNYSKEVLKVSATQFITHLQHRPDSGGLKISTETEMFMVEGMSIEHDLVSLITSDVPTYTPSQKSRVFNGEFEINPVHLDTDFSLALNIQPVEIMYDEHAVTEVIAFLQVPNMTSDAVVGIMQQGLQMLTQYSRAGLQYAIETHKTVHVSVNMRSPYIVIPEYGTLHRGGNVLILDFGKLKVESKPQQQLDNLADLTLSEVETRLYDKYNITITDVKALLADSGDDWHSAQAREDSEYHILPSVAVQLNFFNSVKPEYTELPRFQFTANLERLILTVREFQVYTLIKFYYNLPIPGIESKLKAEQDELEEPNWDDDEIVRAAGRRMTDYSVDYVDGGSPPALIDMDSLPFTFARRRDMRELQREPSIVELKKMRKSVFRNSVVSGKSVEYKSRISTVSDSDRYFTASDNTDDDADEWAKGLEINTVEDHSSLSNIVKALGRFTLAEIVIQISKSADKIDTPYLMLRINRVCAEASLTEFGMALQASLGGIQLIDKIHQGSLGEYLEVLNSKRDADLITLSYRKVDPSCPEFESIYKSIEQAMVLKLSSLKLVCNRAAILYLNTFAQKMVHSMQYSMGDHRLKKSLSNSTILSGPTTETYKHPEPPGFIERLNSQVDTGSPANLTKVHMAVHVEDIEVKLCDHETDYAVVQVTGLEGRLAVRPTRTILQAKLIDLSVEDLTENTLHPKLLTIEDDNVFDFKFIKYNPTTTKPGYTPNISADGSLKLKIGRMQGVYLNKFVTEITSFVEPFLNPEIKEQYKIAAQQAAYNTIQDAQEHGTKISMCIEINSPTVLVPEHSGSTNVILLQLGDLSIKNYFEETEVPVGSGVLQKWDHMYLSLDSVQVMRGKLNMNGITEPEHIIIEPISLQLNFKRALPPHRSDIYYELGGHLHKVNISLLQTDLKVIMAVLRENMTESGHLSPYIDETDLERDMSLDFNKRQSLDTTTPVVEIEEPLLSAPEVSELVKQLAFRMEMDGVFITLLTEAHSMDMEHDSSEHPEHMENIPPYLGLAILRLEKVLISGTKGQDTMEVQLQLQSIGMQDIQEHSKLAVKYIIRSQVKAAGHYDESLPVFDMIYKQKEDGQQHVNITIETMRVNVYVPYLLKMSHFFLDAIVKPEVTHGVTVDTTDLPVTQPRSSIVVSRVSQIKHTPPPKWCILAVVSRSTIESMRSAMGTSPEPQVQPQSDESWSISGEFKQPEIVLFAEPCDPRSRILVMKASAKFNYYLVNGKEDMDAKLKNVQIISGKYGLSKQTASMVLRPCNLEFKRHRESFNALIEMQLKLSDMYMNVSASDIHICLDIWKLIQEDRGYGVDVRDSSPSGGSRHYYDLWNTQSISRHDWLKPDQDTEGPYYSASLFDQNGPPKETVIVDAPKIIIMFEMENMDYHVPRLYIKSNINMELNDISSKKRLEIEGSGLIFGSHPLSTVTAQHSSTKFLCTMYEIDQSRSRNSKSEITMGLRGKQVRAKGDMELEVSYFNDKLSLWEPLIEPVMHTEDHYRPWQLSLKLVQAPSHPISCIAPSPTDHGNDELDSAVNYWLANAARHRASSSETESDTDTEMMVIRNKLDAGVVRAAGKPRTSSDRSYDSDEPLYEPAVEDNSDIEIGIDALNALNTTEDVPPDNTQIELAGQHKSIQGESDSEGELIDTLSSGLESMVSSDSSEDLSEEDEDDLFDSPAKHVFLTAKGPVHLTSGDQGFDTVDGAIEKEDKPDGPLCYYVIIDSVDQLLLNVTPQALDILTEVTQTFSQEEFSTIKSINDLPGFEVYNDLGIEAEITLSDELQNIVVSEHWEEPTEELVLTHAELKRNQWRKSSVARGHLHNIRLSTTSYLEEEKLDNKLVDIDEDEPDGLQHVLRALSVTGHVAINASATLPIDNTKLRSDDLSEKKELMNIRIKGFNELTNVLHKRAVTRMIPLYPPQDNVNYAVVYNVEATHGRKVITFRSPLQIYNQLNVDLELYCQTSTLFTHGSGSASPSDGGSKSYTLLKVVEAGSEFSVPLYAAYHCKLYIAPITNDSGYEISEQGVWWQELCIAKEKKKSFTCLPKNTNTKPFHFKVTCEDGPVERSSVSMAKSTPHFNLHIHPPVVIHNLLPYDMQVAIADSSMVDIIHGENTPLYMAETSTAPKLQIQVLDYLGSDWIGSLDLSTDIEEFKAITMEISDTRDGDSMVGANSNKQLSLSVHTKYTNSMDLFVYSPYWIVNKTNLPIHIRGSRSEVTYNTGDTQDPLLYRFKKYKRKKAKIRIYNSKWTRSFSLDTVGSHGVVICSDKERGRKYHFMLQIEMSRLHLTKIVSILPYFLVVNNYDQPLRFMEENEAADLWHDLEPNKCVPFWPATESKKMFVKFKDSNLCSQHFNILQAHSTVLRMNKGSALVVDVSGGTDTSVTITFRPYEHGDSPVRIENLCEDVFIKLYQKNQSQVSLLSPNQSVLYTWDDPTSERTLLWNVYNRKHTSHPAEITKDKSGSVSLDIQTIRKSAVSESSTVPATNESTGIISSLLRRSKSKEVANPEESSTDDDSDTEMTPNSNGSMVKKTRTDKVQVYWVSYLDGVQRVLMFSQDERIAKKAQKQSDAEPATMEVFLSLRGIGASLVNGLYEEVAFLSLSSSPALWEVQVKSKSKLLNVDLASLLEDKWRQGEDTVQFEDLLHADLEKMEMKKPFLGALKRVYNPALWVHYRQSIHHTYVHSKIHRLQLDNQLSDAYFPTVLYPSPVPSFIVKKSGPKPFIELMLLRRQVPDRDIDTIKYASLLMQEFNIKLDKGFMLSLYDIFASRQQVKTESDQLKADMDMAKQDLKDLAVVHATSRPQRIFFEYLHLSPLKLRVSFSLNGHVHRSVQEDSSFTSDIIEFFLNSVGATLTEIKEVELRMAYFQREGVMLTLQQLQSEVQSHYVSQAVKQAYVLLLGLDVLGNPYGLVKDFTKGLGDFFYEPFMGSIQQPDRFAENLSYGVHSLLGHTVGSMAGSVSLVTGSVGRTIALLSFDESYKMKRARYLQQHPKHLPESIYLAGKSFVMGVAMGVTGVVVSPVRGVKEEGVEGFFKGIGKGLLGLLTKPTGGTVDMVSIAFDGIRRTAEMGEDVVVRMRPARFVHPVLGLKPFSYYQSIGLRILQTVNKGRYTESDIYWAHAPLSMDEKADVVLITDKRVMYLEKRKFWGDWDIEWEVALDQLVGVPGLEDNKLIVSVKKDEESFSFMSSDTHEIACKDQSLLRWLQKKTEDVIVFVNEQY